MRLAVFSDIHGNYHAFEAMLEDFNGAGEFDQIWCLGDFAAFGAHPAECLAKLREMHDTYEKKFKAIGGNTDRYLITGKRPEVPAAKDEAGLTKRQANFAARDNRLAWCLNRLAWEDYDFMAKTIGREASTYAKGYGNIIGVHAIPGDDEPLALRPDSPDEEASDALLDRQGKLVLAGHTHQVMDRTVGNWRVVNPGSVGFSFTQYGKAEWAILTVENGAVEVDLRAVDYDIEAMLAAAAETDYPDVDFMRLMLDRAKND